MNSVEITSRAIKKYGLYWCMYQSKEDALRAKDRFQNSFAVFLKKFTDNNHAITYHLYIFKKGTTQNQFLKATSVERIYYTNKK